MMIEAGESPSTTLWVIGIALSALSLASMSVRRVASLTGVERSMYVVSMAIATLGGALIAVTLPAEPWAFGAIVGLASVELGPSILAGMKRLVGALAKRLGGGE
jgi:hypothetical protein